ncbi:MAG: RpiB/LacA/LacB family sugar-phosphate isomerase [Actinomycetota bacterium]|nr:MAG: RpiB/LacA/LacB family sugar-phosphate isomerase [Actinomycetota bacterium]
MAADHNGVAMKSRLIEFLSGLGHSLDDLGTNGPEVVDYPYLCLAVCREVAAGRADRGIVIGGSGLGETIACNKIHGIRAGLCRTAFDVEISRGNNDSNVLVLAAKVISNKLSEELAQAWLTLPFKGGVHQQRLEQIARLEQGQELL